MAIKTDIIAAIDAATDGTNKTRVVDAFKTVYGYVSGDEDDFMATQIENHIRSVVEIAERQEALEAHTPDALTLS